MLENLNNTLKAKVLIDALPYIKKYNGKIIVIKYGGNAMINDQLKNAVMSDIVLLSLVGIKVVLVHGGGPEINHMLDRVGLKSKFINGLRYTDEKTIEIVQMVLAGKVNKELAALINRHGGKGLGFCGLDDNMIMAKKLDDGVDLGFVGDITSINPKPILDALSCGNIPIIATTGIGEDGQIYNINADTCAAKIAAEVNSENLILMTDTVGLLKDKDDESTLIPEVKVSDVPRYIRDGYISGGMIPKIECCVEAVRRGVRKAVIIDGRVEHSILIEILSNEGIGTLFHT